MTPSKLAALVGDLLRLVPVRVRQWVYLGLAVAALAVLVTSWVRSGLSLEQIGYALVGLAFSLARANTTPPARKG